MLSIESYEKEKQRRRAEVIKLLLKEPRPRSLLDIGCGEGDMTSAISEVVEYVVAVDIDDKALETARERFGWQVELVQASAEMLPFRNSSFESVSMLELLEHMPKESQLASVAEADRVLTKGGTILISIPYKEKIVYYKCVHCGRPTPRYGHLLSMDEKHLTGLLPDGYRQVSRLHIVNLPYITLWGPFRILPVRLWLLIQNVLGRVMLGYWLVMKFVKQGERSEEKSPR